MMKKKFFLCLLCLILLVSGAAAQSENAVRVEKLIHGILDYQLVRTGSADVQAWINGELAQTAGAGSEWNLFALSQSGSYDFAACRQNLLSSIENAGKLSASTQQKYALVLMAMGSNDAFISRTAQETIGAQGIMSWIYGLHLLNNGADGSVTAQQAVEHLLELQLPDGGWALRGEVSDVDVTAMTLQAIAPHAADQRVKASAERAVEQLALRQMESGDFASYGAPNPESAAQVMTALAALNIDVLEDERFIKNGRTLLDVIAGYQLPDGSFCHAAGGPSNANATVQSLHALIAWQRMTSGKGSFYLIDRTGKANAAAAEPLKAELGYKAIAMIVIAALALVACGVLLFLRKRSPKNYLAVLGAAAVLAAFVQTTDFQTAESYYSGMAVVKTDPVGYVTMSISCSEALGKTSVQLPADGVMLAPTSFAIAKGDTAYTILTEAAQTYGVRLDTSGPQGMIYVSGINHLYEFECGELSGWVFMINGESAAAGCDQTLLNDGDVIEWRYTCELGAEFR